MPRGGSPKAAAWRAIARAIWRAASSGAANGSTGIGRSGRARARRAHVDEQRQDRMVVGRGGELDLAAPGQLAVGRDHLGDEPVVQREQAVTMTDLERADRGDRLRALREVVEHGIEPGEQEEDLELEQQLVRHRGRTSVRRARALSPLARPPVRRATAPSRAAARRRIATRSRLGPPASGPRADGASGRAARLGIPTRRRRADRAARERS